MIPFHAIIEWMFSGFKIDYDSKVLHDSVTSDDEHVFMIKKSSYFISLFNGGRLLGILFIACANIALLLIGKAFPIELIGGIVLGLSINILLWFWSIFEYLAVYDKNYGIFKIMPARDRYPILENGDKQFARFFNQTLALILFYFLLMGVFIGGTIFYRDDVTQTEAALLLVNGFLLIFQYIQIQRSLLRFVNLEMDFTIVTEDQIKHTNQVGISFQSKSIDISKIKNIQVNKQGRIRSGLDYGEVGILTEGDAAGLPDLVLPYIRKPETVEALIYQIKNGDIIKEKKEENITIENTTIAGETQTQPIQIEMTNTVGLYEKLQMF